MSSNRDQKMPLPEKQEEGKEKTSVPQKSSDPIHVVATRAGFYKNSRKQEGDKFTIDSERQLGTWMKKI